MRDIRNSTEPVQSRSSEQQLIQQARVGGLLGEHARTQLLQIYYPWIQKRCAQILRNAADADDASQDSALRIHQQLPKFEGRSSLRTWMGTIVTRECINVIRRNSRTMLREHVAEMISLHEDVFRGEEPALPAEDQMAVRDALTGLQPIARDVLQLRFYGESSLEDISAVLGISLSAAKMRLYRAMEQFVSAYSAPV